MAKSNNMRGISARLFAEYAADAWGNDQENPGAMKRLLLVNDVYNKAWSYAFINKSAFILSIIFAILILLWPSIAFMAESWGKGLTVLGSAIIQTSITGMGALAFAVYFQYKGRQTAMENLLRQLVFNDALSLNAACDLVMGVFERQDIGFSFHSNATTTHPVGISVPKSTEGG